MRSFTSFCLLLSTAAIFAQVSFPLPAFEQYIEKARQDWQTPGLAVGIVYKGEIIMAKGFGEKRLGSGQAVDGKTIFGIASTTKAMTAACMAMLVDEGKVKWDDPVIKHLPGFRIADPFITAELTIRDLFTHNGGMGNADYLWYGTDLNSKQIMEKLPLIEPAYSLRGGWIYQNIMYLIAGQVIEKVSGQPWETFVRERIFQPLGMHRSYSNQQMSMQEPNRSTPHFSVNGKVQTIEDASADGIAPAGAVWSCVEDMTKWLRFVLDSARVNGNRLLKADSYSEWLKPQSIVNKSGFYPTASLTKPHWTTYALGWFQQDYRGRMVHFHTGSLDGTVAIIGLMPEENIGIYVLGNLDHTELRHALMYKAFDLAMGIADGADWNADFLKLYTSLRKDAAAKQQQQLAKRVSGTQPSLPQNAWTGTYENPLYGKVEMKIENGVLRAVSGDWLQMTLQHWHYDTYRGTYDKAWLDPAWVQLRMDKISGQAAGMEIDGIFFNKK